MQERPLLLHPDVLVVQQPHLVLSSLLNIMDQFGLLLEDLLLFDLSLQLCLHLLL